MSDSSSSTEAGGTSWFVVWTASRAEKKVEARLAGLGLSPWLPTVKEKHKWSDRWKEVVRPLFPGYLFARARDGEWGNVLRTPGVLTIVKHGGQPALLTADFVRNLRNAVQGHGTAAEAVPQREYAPGNEVIVQEGALAGMRGVVRERKNSRQLVIWISEIGQGVALTIGSALVKSAD